MSIVDPPVPPSRAVLNRVLEINRQRGNETGGFLSEERGFMPAEPLRQMPGSHRVWDEMSARLPALHRTLRLRRELDEMPLLHAGADDLDESCLWRASALMSIFAHAYVRVQPDPPRGLPACIRVPWEEVTRRLDRRVPFLSYIDLVIYNWKLRDASLADPMRVENLQLLFPTVGSRSEEILTLTQVEIVAQCSSLVGAVIRAQEAVLQEDHAALEEDLLHILRRIQHISEVSLQKLDPNPFSEFYIDPIVWAKTVAPFAVPITPGVQGPSGTAAPPIHLLDSFFGRVNYDSFLGKEAVRIRRWYPAFWREFFEAVSQVSVRDYVDRCGDRHLQGVFQTVVDGYASDKGFLGVHRLKAYGLLDTAFKVGRVKTIGGFAGLFQDRTWEKAVHELAVSRDERYLGTTRHSHLVHPTVEHMYRGGRGGKIAEVTFDLAGTGVLFEPGDRCEVLSENTQDLVQRTLGALDADGTEPIQLDRAWQEAVEDRLGPGSITTLPLERLLAFGHIRPVSRSIARELLALTASSRLRSIVNARAEDQWELWDLLEMLRDGGFDTRRLWKAEPWERESICNIVPPEIPRQYSISSAQTDGDRTLRLTVGALHYHTQQTELTHEAERSGTASTYLAQLSGANPSNGTVWIRTTHPLRFHLPREVWRPIVMVAGGTGIAPFRGFLQERARIPGAGENILLLGVRTREQFAPYADELDAFVRAGALRLEVAVSQEDVVIRAAPGDGRLTVEPGPRRRLNAVIESDAYAGMLWDLLRHEREGGRGGVIYVCGQTNVASSVMGSLKTVIAEGLGPDHPDGAAEAVLGRVVAEGRYMQDVFTTYSGPYGQHGTAFDASEVMKHNSDEAGYWMIVDGKVYDLTSFVGLHAGGNAIITAYAGLDGSHAYRAVLHHVNSEVDALLGMYEIGYIRRLQFGSAWAVVVGPDGLRPVPLQDAFRTWLKFVYLVIEMENAFANDLSFLPRPTTEGEPAGLMTPLKIQLMAEVHAGFIKNYFGTVLGPDLDVLWSIATAIGAPFQDVRHVRHEIDALIASPMYQAVQQCAAQIHAKIDQLLDAQETDEASWEPLRALCEIVRRENSRFMAEVKDALAGGVRCFEQREARILHDGRALLDSVQRVPTIAASYLERFVTEARAIPGTAGTPAGTPSPEAAEDDVIPLPGHGIAPLDA